jgi:hypothetical protein
MIKRLLITLTATLACLASTGQAAISFGSTGTPILTFDAQPTVADGWSTLGVGNNAATYTTDTALDAAVIANTTAASVSTPVGSSTTVPPSKNAIARWNGTGHYLQSRPTTVDYTLLMATLQNDSGNTLSSVTVAYTYGVTVPAGLTIQEEIPGFRVFYSLTGEANSWTLIPELSGVGTAGNLSAVINPAGGWAPGTPLYLLWADDNAAASDAANAPQEGGYTIDDFAVTTGAAIPPNITQQPVNATVAEEQVATLTVTATGTGLTYQWYKGATPIAGATSSTLLVTNTAGSNRPWSVPGDNGSYHVVVSGSANPAATSATVTVTVTPDTTAPVAEWVNCTANAGEIVLNVSESLDNYTAAVTNFASYVVESPTGNLTVTNITHGANSPRVHLFVDQALDPAKQYHLSTTLALPDRAQTANFLPANTRLPILCASNHIADLSHVWKYNEADLDLPSDWTSAAYVDTGADWKSGAGPLDAKLHGTGATGENCRDTIPFYPTNGVGLGPVGTCISYVSPVTQTNLITTYFRTHFTSPSAGGSSALLHLQGKVDDGAVIYLNGTEIGRVRMAAAPTAITRTSLANAGVGDGDAQDSLEYYVPGLVAGDNVLAIEVHQNGLTSSDKTLGLIISLVTGGQAAGPQLTITHSGNTGHVLWSGTGTLAYKNSLSDPTWTVIAGPYAQSNGQNDVTINLASPTTRFYRVQ